MRTWLWKAGSEWRENQPTGIKETVASPALLSHLQDVARPFQKFGVTETRHARKFSARLADPFFCQDMCESFRMVWDAATDLCQLWDGASGLRPRDFGARLHFAGLAMC